MKVLEFHELPVEDRFNLSFEGTFAPEAGLDHTLDPLLQALESCAGDWMPNVVKGRRRRKYSRAAFWKAVEEARDEHGVMVGLHRTKWPALDMTLQLWFPPHPPKLDFYVSLQPLSFFANAERSRGIVELVREWASRHLVTHAMTSSLAEDQLSGAPYYGRDERTARRDGFDKIYEVGWLNVFGPKLMESVGRERMLSTPAYKMEELPNGTILLVTRPTPTDFASDEARVAQARIQVHLRPELDEAIVLRTLRERSAALVPVEPRFHPDVAPLLLGVVDQVLLGERQRKIAELNAYQPPEPEEWRPASSALPCDVEDPDFVLDQYRQLAQGLVAALRTPVPSFFDLTPGTLTDLDLYFWREDFPRRYRREVIDEHTAPAVGAYLGSVLVRRLGGQWIPRKKLEESQVRVGNRVWLPFLRARRYMHSCQTLLDYSLTQLFLEAERQRS
ncbi:hypothetical protein D7Y13_22000 [Corallococcus praedator]|uniref:Uncharacterized protein n=1 Tax=Corallococcus praedator TaxID=2316724 RepID=A0ABX9QFE2_9BACT|nr:MULTISPECIES: hypothetical protein [Corallococcus]RKH32720.1 hypothetical protein D7X75_14675 [Corallococcus sp. CA031C]RKI05674.1 hypothetical protein D7Y13_22000 [Corallococcus praedator]